MKKRIRSSEFLLVLFAIAVLSAWQVTRQRVNHLPSNALIGHWEYEGGNVTFRADGTLDVVYKEHKYGRRKGAYRVDFSQQPAQLDMQLDSKSKTSFFSCEVSPNGVLRISEEASSPEDRSRIFGPHSTVLHRQS